MKVKFPERKKDWISSAESIQYHRYYPIHIQYVLNLLKHVGATIEMIDPTEFKVRSQVIFDCVIDEKTVRFDFSDFEKLNDNLIDSCHVYFKFHYNDSHLKYKNVFPFTPVNFHNWTEYHELDKCISYNAKGLVLNNQTPFGAALERRSYVHKILLEKYGNKLSFDRKTQREFFLLINKGLVSICVPGARNNMLDRGQCQYMAFGACTISPKLVTRLSWNKKLKSGVHYLECKEDYSDLIEKIEWVKNNPSLAIEIGKNAKKLFKNTSTPRKQIQWIKNCIELC